MSELKCHIDLCDFTQCRLIEERMRYADIFDFVRVSAILKTRFERLTDDGKLFYKYFVYAHKGTNEAEQNAIWDYLNGERKCITSYVKYINKKQNMI